MFDFQTLKVVDLLSPAADAAGRSSDIITLKNANRVQIHVHLNQGNAATVTLALMQATSAAGAGAKALANNIPIFADLDTAASDTWVRQADGVSFTTDAGLKQKMVCFDVDPAQLDVQGGFNHLYVTTGASNAANITAAYAIIHPKTMSAAPPSDIV